MNKYVKVFAGVSAGVMMATSAAFAGSNGDACFKAVSAYEDGMPSISASKDMAVEKQVELISAEFKKVISASASAHRCYLKMQVSASSTERVALRESMKKAGAVLVNAQSQFSGWIDEVSVAMVSEIAPAAGADTKANTDEPSAMESSLDVLIGSYMLLDDAAEVASKIKIG